MTARDVLAALQSRGVELRVSGDKLLLSPDTAVDTWIIAEVRANKVALLELLPKTPPARDSLATPEPLPRWHWPARLLPYRAMIRAARTVRLPNCPAWCPSEGTIPDPAAYIDAQAMRLLRMEQAGDGDGLEAAAIYEALDWLHASWQPDHWADVEARAVEAIALAKARTKVNSLV